MIPSTVHNTRRSRLLCLCLLVAPTLQIFSTVFVAPFLEVAGRLRSTSAHGDRGSRLQRAVVSMSDLNVGDKYEGTIKRVAQFGAFVDFGCERDGLVHISCLKDGFVGSASDEVQEGDAVTVWVKSVEDGKIGLTMVESKLSGGGGGGGGGGTRRRANLTPFEGLIGGRKIKGTVKSIQKFGAFVEVEVGGEVAQGLVHVSEMSEGFVEDPFSVVSQGDEVQVTVKDVDVGAGKLSLSMK